MSGHQTLVSPLQWTEVTLVAPAGGPVVVHRRQKLDLPESNLQVCRVFDTDATLLGQDSLRKDQFARQTLVQFAQDKTDGETFPEEETFILAHEGKKLK